MLAGFNREFGFRTAAEIQRFSYLMYLLLENAENDQEIAKRILDAQIYQKVLPRIYGGRKKTEPVLLQLLHHCTVEHEWDSGTLKNESDLITNQEALLGDRAAAEALVSAAQEAYLPNSANKISSMIRRLWSENFVAFAEA